MTKAKQGLMDIAASNPSKEPPLMDALRADFEATREERDAVDASVRATFDLTGAYLRVSSSLPAIRASSERLQKALPEFDVSVLDNVERFGRAALYAQSVERATNTAVAHHGQVLEALERLYARFYRNAEFLAAEGLFDARVLRSARSGTAVQDRAADLRLLAVEFAERELALAGRSLITRADIEHAFTLSDSALDLVAVHEAQTDAQRAAQRDRQQSFALFARAWSEIRRAITWLRWHEGDVDTIAPPL